MMFSSDFCVLIRICLLSVSLCLFPIDLERRLIVETLGLTLRDTAQSIDACLCFPFLVSMHQGLSK